MRKFGIALAFVAIVAVITLSYFTSVTTNAATDPAAWTTQAIYPTSFITVPDRTERDIGRLAALAGTQIEKIGYYNYTKKDLVGSTFLSANHEATTQNQDSIIRTRMATERRTTAVTPATETEKSNGDRFAVAYIERRRDLSSTFA